MSFSAYYININKIFEIEDVMLGFFIEMTLIMETTGMVWKQLYK